jgi:hypothetical protein
MHGELLKLGIDVGQTSVTKYMARRRRPPSQGGRTFLRNHADGIVAMDLFVVPTISFQLLYGLLILRHDRRRILWMGVTAHPTGEWVARQLTEACGWTRHQHTCCAIEIRSMVRLSPGACAPWVFAIDQLRRGRQGKMPLPNGRSARSDGNASIISWSSENSTFVTRCYRT